MVRNARSGNNPKRRIIAPELATRECVERLQETVAMLEAGITRGTLRIMALNGRTLARQSPYATPTGRLA